MAPGTVRLTRGPRRWLSLLAATALGAALCTLGTAPAVARPAQPAGGKPAAQSAPVKPTSPTTPGKPAAQSAPVKPAQSAPVKPAAAAAKPAAQPAAVQPAAALPYRLTSTPLLLVHGFSDDCGSAFDKTDNVDPGTSAVRTISYFTSHGFPTVQTVGYYSGSWTPLYSDGPSATSVSDQASCNVNVQGQLASGHCGDPQQPYYYTTAPIEHLACLMAWYLYAQPQPVDIIAHSMGGLVVRGAMYYSVHHPVDSFNYTFPPGALPVSRIVTVATPHDGLQGAIAELYNLEYKNNREVQDMTVCPNYAAHCTISTLLDVPLGGPAQVSTSDFMQTMRTGGKPTGSVDTYWALMGSSQVCNPVNQRTLGSCVAEMPFSSDPYASSDFVVQADSQMAMAADAKVFYGDIEYLRLGNTVGVKYNSGATGYSHEANTCSGALQQVFPTFAGPCATAPYYLNDGRTGTTKAWLCTTGCTGGVGGAGIENLPYSGGSASATTVPYSLGEMAHLLLDPTRSQIGHAARAGNDYPYAGMGLFDDQSEGIDGFTQFYGQCDSFASWKVYENLGGSQRPSSALLPAVGWKPTDASSISPVVGYAGLTSKVNTWGDAHDWIRSDQGLHAAPYFGVPFDGIPQPGSIAVWGTTADDPVHGMGGQFGHVAYVTDVVDANTIRIEGYNMHGNGEWSTAQVSRSGGGADVAFGGTVSFGWPTAFVHLGDGTAGPVRALPASGVAYPTGTYGPTSASGGPSFTLTGAAFPGTVNGWTSAPSHGVLGWELYTTTHVGAADSTATWNPTLPTANGCYRVDAFVPDTGSNSTYAMFSVTDQRFGTSVVPVNEEALTNRYANLGVFQADSTGHLRVVLTDQGPGAPAAYAWVAADGMRYVPTPCTAPHRAALLMDPATPGFTTTDVWYAVASHGLRGNERWTNTNGSSTLATATYTASLSAGCYLVDAFVPDYGSNSPAALYTITDGHFSPSSLADVDQGGTTNAFVSLGVFQARADGSLAVKVVDQNPVGLFIGADAMRFTPAPCVELGRWSTVIDPGSGAPDFSTAGPTAGLGDVHGWYPVPGGGLRGNQWWTNSARASTASTATYTPAGLPSGCFDVRAFITNNHANNPKAGYAVAVTGPSSGHGLAFAIDQSTTTNGWIDLGHFAVPSDSHLTVSMNDTGPTNLGLLYTSADAIDFRLSTGC